MDDYALVLNAGSSSLKFCVYWRSEVEDWHLESQGQIEGVGTSPRIFARNAADEILIDQKLDASVCDGFNALETLAAWLSFMYGDEQVVGVGHRVVHGGTRYARPTVGTRSPGRTLSASAACPFVPAIQFGSD